MQVSTNPNPSEEESSSHSLFGHKRALIIIGACVLIIGLLLTVILVPLSISTIDKNHLGFKKHNIKNTVYTDKVYQTGRYVFGPSFTTVTFPGTYQRIEFRERDIVVFAENGLEFPVECDLYYRLNKDNLVDIFDRFGKAYHSRIVDEAKASLKNTGPMFSVEQYIRNRTAVQRKMVDNLNKDLHTFHITVEAEMFQILTITFPPQIAEKYLQTAVQTIQNERSLLQREVDLINKDTEFQVAQLVAQRNIVNAQAEERRQYIVNHAKAESSAIRKNATYSGIQHFMGKINITNQSHSDKIIEFYALIDNEAEPERLISGNVNFIQLIQ